LLKLAHPASLNVFKQYLQIRQILRRTSRANNPAWYQEALLLDHQLHIRCDGDSATIHYFHKRTNAWSDGPAMDAACLHNPEQAALFARELITFARGKNAKSLGVVLHVANEFATAELKPELNDPDTLPQLRQTAVIDPAAILEDTSVSADQASWRVVPYPAEGGETIAASVVISRQLAPFLDVIRETGESQNFPLVTHALSAPLVAFTALGALVAPAEGKPFVGILQYPWFTVVGFFDKEGELKLIRTMQHRGRKRVTNFRHALNTTNVSLELQDPDVLIVPLGEEVDHMLGSDLRISMPESRIEVIQPPAESQGIPAWCLDLWLAVNGSTRPNRLECETMRLLAQEKWALQDFLPVPPEVAELYPSFLEIRMLRIFKLARVALFLLAVGGLAWLGLEYKKTIDTPQWSFNSMDATMMRSQLANLNKERALADHWHNLLADRSKAWVAMEDLARMFPEDSGIKIKTYVHTVRPVAPGRGVTTAGFVREWRITGLARPNGVSRLNELNTREGISAHFAEVAKLTGNAAYRTDESTRGIVVTMRSQENRQFRSPTPREYAANADSSFPLSFDIIITQQFEANDPLALTTSKAP